MKCVRVGGCVSRTDHSTPCLTNSLTPPHPHLPQTVKDRPAVLARRIEAAEKTQTLEAQIRATKGTKVVWMCMYVHHNAAD